MNKMEKMKKEEEKVKDEVEDKEGKETVKVEDDEEEAPVEYPLDCGNN